MTREFDPKKSYLAVKANEKMIAYAGFNIHLEAYREKKEGVVKISSFQRALWRRLSDPYLYCG